MIYTLWLSIYLLLIPSTQARPLRTPVIRNTAHISISAVKSLGDVHSNCTYVKRDLGFQGQIGQHILLSYGDTLYSDANYSDTFRGIVSNSIAFVTSDPTVVVDPLLDDNGYPCQFVKTEACWGEDQSTHAIGITSVIETQPNEGIIFTLLNHRPNGTDNILGAGLALIKLNTTIYPPVPSATRPSPYMWNGTTEPWYGDVCAFKSPIDNYIYAYGHALNNPWVYLTRIPSSSTNFTDLSSYEYYHGPSIGWTSTPLYTPNLTETESIFWQVNQGQIFFSTYFNAYLFIYCDNFWSSTILVRSASKPEGPWSDASTLYKADPFTKNGNIYAAVPHPYLDGTGKTLTIGFTNWPNVIQVVRVVFG